MYRIATIIEPEFANQEDLGGKCPLYGTFFKAFKFGEDTRRPLVLKVLIFACRSKPESDNFL